MSHRWIGATLVRSLGRLQWSEVKSVPLDDRVKLTAEQGSGGSAPFAREVVTSDGLTLHYEVHGTGAPLFFGRLVSCLAIDSWSAGSH